MSLVVEADVVGKKNDHEAVVDVVMVVNAAVAAVVVFDAQRS